MVEDGRVEEKSKEEKKGQREVEKRGKRREELVVKM